MTFSAPPLSSLPPPHPPTLVLLTTRGTVERVEEGEEEDEEEGGDEEETEEEEEEEEKEEEGVVIRSQMEEVEEGVEEEVRSKHPQLPTLPHLPLPGLLLHLPLLKPSSLPQCLLLLPSPPLMLVGDQEVGMGGDEGLLGGTDEEGEGGSNQNKVEQPLMLRTVQSLYCRLSKATGGRMVELHRIVTWALSQTVEQMVGEGRRVEGLVEEEGEGGAGGMQEEVPVAKARVKETLDCIRRGWRPYPLHLPPLLVPPLLACNNWLQFHNNDVADLGYIALSESQRKSLATFREEASVSEPPHNLEVSKRWSLKQCDVEIRDFSPTCRNFPYRATKRLLLHRRRASECTP